MKRRLISVAAVLLAFAVMGNTSSSSDSSDDVTKVGEVGSVNAPEAEAESTTAALQSEYHVGDVLEINGMRVVYVSSGEFQESNEFLAPDEGYMYVFMEFYFENISDSDKSISVYNFDGYADNVAVDMYYGGDDSISGTLSAGRHTMGKIYFEVPVDATTVEAEYSEIWLSGNNVVFVYDGNTDSGFEPEVNSSASEDAYAVGDVIEGNGLRITYLECGEYTSDNQFIQPDDGYRYIYLKFNFENISDSDDYVSFYDFNCFADGRSCDMEYFADNQISATISSGRTAEGYVYFQVPVDAVTIEVEYTTNYFTSGHIVFSYSE